MESSPLLTFGLIVSCRCADVESIAAAISNIGGKIIYRTATANPLFVLSSNQIEKALKGDLAELKEIYNHKMKEPDRTHRAESID